MKEDDKKENGDGDGDDTVNTEVTESEQPEKRICLDESENNKTIAEQNGQEESKTVNEVDEDVVHEAKVDIPVVDVANEEVPVQVAETEVAEPEPVEPVKETPPPAVKTTPTRGRGGARGRGVARRGRSSR